MEFLLRFPILKSIIEAGRKESRQLEIANNLFERWAVRKEIAFDAMELELRASAREEGLDEDQIFCRISELYNPSGSV